MEANRQRRGAGTSKRSSLGEESSRRAADAHSNPLGDSRGILMTVMLDSFFGVHPFVVRSGLWAKMKPGEKDLYVFLMEESERNCTRQLRVTDARVRATVGVAPRTLCNARKKLQERGLILYKRGEGNKYTYTICDPRTKKAYPGDPRTALACPRRSRVQRERNPSSPLEPAGEQGARLPTVEPRGALVNGASGRPEDYGLPDVF